MAGFFGMFNSTKPGPGVSKNEPKKKGFFRFWELFFRKFFKLIVANFLYVLVSFPVVTQGLAQAGMTYVTRNFSREKHVFLMSDFFDTIKKNWKQALANGIIELVVGGCLIFDIFYAWGWLNAEESTGILPLLFFVFTMFLVVIFCFARFYLYFQMITFKMSLKQLWKNSLLFAIIGLKENLIIAVTLVLLYALAGVLLNYFFWFSLPIVLLLYILIFPAFRSFLIQFVIFPLIKHTIIDPYYAQHPNEDLDKRHDLNLDVEQTTDEQMNMTDESSDVIFKDNGREEKTVDAIPKQYSQEELRRGKRIQRESRADVDDDGTI